MKIYKTAQPDLPQAIPQEDLDRIAALARREMRPEEVYTFAVRLCDNEIDRDLERFPAKTLEELAGLLVGKCGLFDHQWSAAGQTARLYKTEVVREPKRLTRAGDGYCWLEGYAYMVRTAGAETLIAEIEGGIKKEVSVGCAVERRVCSICGGDPEACGHQKGERYGGQLCFASLEGASDAYEFSFVAVPAQPMAGVVKSAGQPRNARLERLEEEAALGRKYLDGLRRETVRLALLADRELDREAVQSLADKLSLQELEALAKSYARQAGSQLPLSTQLRYERDAGQRPERDEAFLI